MRKPRAASPAIALVAFALVAFAMPMRSVRAQRVRGVVRDSASREAIGGAVVSISDSAGRFLARSIADGRGRFDVPRLRGSARVRVVRIGFRPWDGRLAPGDGDAVLAVALQAIPVELSSITARGERVCPGRPADAHAVQARALDVWNQARAALLAMVVEREAHPPRIRLLAFERTRDPVLRQTIQDSVSTKDVVAERSYAAPRPAALLAEQGYARDQAGGDREYFAPDAAVLLDTTFAETHCLSLVSGGAPHAGQVGIRFEAVRAGGRDTLVDVSGTLWLDAPALALRSLEFQYTGLEPAARGAGGTIEFADMPTGVPMVVRWSIHAPMLATEQAYSPNGVTKVEVPRAQRVDSRVLGYRETGGDLVSADWGNGVAWHGAYPRLTGQVVNDDGEGVRGVVVWLVGTGDTVATDDQGRFALPYVADGIYTVEASDTALAREGISRVVPASVQLLAPGDHQVPLVFHARSELLALACPAGSFTIGTGTLFARVVDERGEAQADAQIEVAARQRVVAHDTLTRTVTRTGRTGGDGRFVICGAALDEPLAIRARKDGRTASVLVTDWGDGVVRRTLVLRPAAH